MKKLLLFILLTSCKSYTPTVSTITVCDEAKASEYVKDCMKDLDTSNASNTARWRKDCFKQAKEMFCKPVKVLNVRGTLVKCEDAPEKYKGLCK